MPASWTAEQIIALAPDPASAKAGREQANLRKWSSLGTDEHGAWGLCQGSGKEPYQAVVDLGEPAFKCSCPSRKFPCKHGLGLLLLWASARASFTTAAPPWVGEWRAGRAKRLEVREAKLQAVVEHVSDPAAEAVVAKQTAKRLQQREERVDAAVDDLTRWLNDLLRHGITDLAARPAAYLLDPARRLIDGQAPGLARLVRELPDVIAGANGQQRLLERLGRIQLLASAWKRRAELPAEVVADARLQIGFTVPQEQVLATEPVSGTWTVVGRVLSEEDHLRTARSWLISDTGRQALVLHFAAGAQPLDTSLVVGARFAGALCYFPGVQALRALVHSRGDATTVSALPPGSTIADAVETFARDTVRCPWLERGCMILRAVVPLLSEGSWWLRDAAGDGLPLAATWGPRWDLLGWSGGHPVTICAEYDGDVLTPVSGSAAAGMLAW